MSSGETNDQIQRDAQVAGGQDEAHAAQIEGRLKDLHTCLPGIIVSFDQDKQTASVQPAIKRIFTEQGAVNLPVCVDVPVQFPGGGDFFLTFPVKAGDECILLFSERAIDYWFANGGTQLPAEYRLHDLSDALAQVGLNSQPKKLAALQMDGAELRTRDRSTYIRLTNGTIYMKGDIIHEGNNTQTGNLTRTGTSTTSGAITGQGGLAVSGGSGASIAGNLTTTGTSTAADHVSGGKSGKAHTHTVPTGGNTSQPS